MALLFAWPRANHTRIALVPHLLSEVNLGNEDTAQRGSSGGSRRTPGCSGRRSSYPQTEGQAVGSHLGPAHTAHREDA